MSKDVCPGGTPTRRWLAARGVGTIQQPRPVGSLSLVKRGFSMAWMFERTVEAAAWVAMTVAWASLGLALWWFFLFVATLGSDPDYQLLRDSTKAAG
ncbi:MAG: hypothetical protein AAF743_11735, partial [Planctomycetota bacterium]